MFAPPKVPVAFDSNPSKNPVVHEKRSKYCPTAVIDWRKADMAIIFDKVSMLVFRNKPPRRVMYINPIIKDISNAVRPLAHVLKMNMVESCHAVYNRNAESSFRHLNPNLPEDTTMSIRRVTTLKAYCLAGSNGCIKADVNTKLLIINITSNILSKADCRLFKMYMLTCSE